MLEVGFWNWIIGAAPFILLGAFWTYVFVIFKHAAYFTKASSSTSQ